jgi:predicted glycoside hydrolase/deacetylase ChbG (UPF0249 family)
MRRRDFLGALSAPLLAQSAPEKSTAELLGYSPNEKLLMVHADDAGMCHSVNAATAEALKSGAVQSASIMMPCPWVSEIAELARSQPELDFGLHLALTSEWRHYRWPPASPAASVPGLLDPDRYLWRDVRSVAKSASALEVAQELRAQIARARHFGIRFTHVDTHMGTLYARKDFFDAYTAVAREAGVPCMLPRPSGVPKEELREYPITAEDIYAKEREGFVLLDRLVTGVPGRSVEERRASYRQFLRELKPGVTKLIVHLSMNDPEIRAVTNNWEQRWADFQFWTSTEARSLLNELGIKPITYREIGKAGRSAQAGK